MEAHHKARALWGKPYTRAAQPVGLGPHLAPAISEYPETL